MTLVELKSRIASFRNDTQKYYELLAESRDQTFPRIVKNQELIELQSALLNNEYGVLEKYINKFGNDPHLADPVNRVQYSAYFNSFSGDILQRVFPSLRAVLQDLDIISGKINQFTEVEFQNLFKSPTQLAQEGEDTERSIDYWRVTNPFWLIWKILCFFSRHKFIGGLVLLLLTLLAIDYFLVWENLKSVFAFLSELF